MFITSEKIFCKIRSTPNCFYLCWITHILYYSFICIWMKLHGLLSYKSFDRLNYIPNYWLIPTKLLHFSDKRPEQSIASARASVMIYDDLNKKWVPSGSSHGLSKVHIYHHFLNNTFRVVGRKLQDHEVNHNDTNVNIYA